MSGAQFTASEARPGWRQQGSSALMLGLIVGLLIQVQPAQKLPRNSHSMWKSGDGLG